MDTKNLRVAALVTFAALFLTSCDLQAEEDYHDGSSLSPEAIKGEWTLQSLFDKTGVILGASQRGIAAGQETKYVIFNGNRDYEALFLIRGGAVFAQDHYEIWLNTAVSIEGLGDNSDNAIDTGSYTISDNRITKAGSNPDQGQMSMNWGFEGAELVLEDDEMRLRFAK